MKLYPLYVPVFAGYSNVQHNETLSSRGIMIFKSSE